MSDLLNDINKNEGIVREYNKKMREFFCARTKISDFSQLYMYIL